MKLVVLAFLAGSALACAPLTFSDPGSIDFERYRSARVEGDWADYLADELTETSGFEWVTTDPEVDVDLVISVSIFVAPEVECECEGGCECNCTCNTEYDATASYVATNPAGNLVDQGSENDTSWTAGEAAEDVLDQIALHYIRPYRL